MPDNSVHCCVTSPPYFGLRDYNTGSWIGGDPLCEHSGEGQVCKKCGAKRIDLQIGLEQTPEAYVEELVAVFREVRRVLRPDGTLWLNLGDSYAAQRSGSHQPAETIAGGKHGKTETGEIVNRGREAGYNPTRNASAIGLKHKDLIGIPWRVAFALQADGWWLRQDIIWSKKNPTPESVRDRCTKSHEYIFLMSKSAKYFFDPIPIEEPAKWERWGNQTENKSHPGAAKFLGGKTTSELPIRDKKNKRDVWTISTKPYKGAHFATFNPELITPCILAGTSAMGCCSRCGTPVKRVGKGDNWVPGCSCKGAIRKPCVVLDPFGGSGTTGKVANDLGRDGILMELNPEYCKLIEERIKN